LYPYYIEKLSTIADPLNNLLRKDTKFQWGKKQKDAFISLKSLICNAIVLAYPNYSRPFMLRTDASDYGLGCVINQKAVDGSDRPIAFASRSLSSVEKNYYSTEKECPAIVWALKKFEHYLDGQEF